MSHYIDTQQTPYGESTGLSTRQRLEIVLGIVVASALAIAAFAYANRTESPVIEQAVVQPVAESYAGVDDLATRSAAPAQSFAGTDDLATRSAVPAQSFAGSDDLATRSSTVGARAIVEQSIVDALEARSGAVSSAVVGAQSYAGSDDLASRSSAVGAGAIIEQSILDALEARSGAMSPAVVGTTGPRYAGSDDSSAR